METIRHVEITKKGRDLHKITVSTKCKGLELVLSNFCAKVYDCKSRIDIMYDLPWGLKLYCNGHILLIPQHKLEFVAVEKYTSELKLI